MTATLILEDAIKKVESLTDDLSAEIVIQKETEGYFRIKDERARHSISDAYDRYGEPKEYVHSKPRIAKPDTARIKAAKQELQQIYNSVELCSVKYMAGKALGTEMDTLCIQVKKQLDSAGSEDLETLYNLMCASRPAEEEHEGIRRAAGTMLGYPEGFILGDEFGRIGKDVIEIYKRLGWDTEELGKIYREGSAPTVRKAAKIKLRDIMRRSYSDKEAAVSAGNELGYSGLRVWWSRLFSAKR